MDLDFLTELFLEDLEGVEIDARLDTDPLLNTAANNNINEIQPIYFKFL